MNTKMGKLFGLNQSHYLKRAKDYDEHLRLHTEGFQEYRDVQNLKPFLDIIKRVKKEVNEDEERLAKFLSKVSYPLITVSVTDAIADQVNKVLDAQDFIFHTKEELYRYLIKIKESNYWKSCAVDRIMSSPNTIIVVDKDVDTYFYEVDISTVEDITVDSNGVINYLKFNEDEDTILEITETDYIRTKDDVSTTYYHGLGECPAFFIGSEFLVKHDSTTRKSGLSTVIGLLDDYFIFHTNKKHLDWENAYPASWEYELDEDEEAIRADIRDDLIDHYTGDDLRQEEDRRYSFYKKVREKSKGGVGKKYTIPAPMDSSEKDLRIPYGTIPIETSALNYNVEELKRQEEEIFYKATGRPMVKDVADRPVSQQIEAQYEGEKNVLMWYSNQLSVARKKLCYFISKMQFGEAYEITCDFGSQFFRPDERAILETMALYYNTGVPQSLYFIKSDALKQTQTRNKPIERERMELLSKLEPLPNLSIKDAKEMASSGLIDIQDWTVKVNFQEFIIRYELEEGDILKYTGELREHLSKIKSKLYEYAKSKQIQGGRDTLQEGGRPNSQNVQRR